MLDMIRYLLIEGRQCTPYAEDMGVNAYELINESSENI